MKHLTEKDRYFIEFALKKKMSVADIAKELGFSRNTIYVEIKRGLTKQLSRDLKEVYVYLADAGQRIHDEMRKRKTGRPNKLSSQDEFIIAVKDKIKNEKFSPEAACYVLSRKVCVKTIYNYIHKGYIPGLTVYNLPYCTKKRNNKEEISGKRKYSINHKSIEDRPMEANTRSVTGHWEMDTVYSSKDDLTCLLVLTERKTREEIIIKVPDRTCNSILKGLNRLERSIGTINFRNKFKTITCDNGKEFENSDLIEKSYQSNKKRTALYYAHPYCSSERGSNENANKLIRRWIPKGDDIGLYTNQEIMFIQDWINNYPRRLHNGKSTMQVMQL